MKGQFGEKNGSYKHGDYGNKTYLAWVNMHRRCYNKKSPDYRHHGSRGIRVCERWHRDSSNGYQNFKADMGKAPPHLSLDRKDNDGNYEPDNCRWATPKQQANNRRPRKDEYRISDGNTAGHCLFWSKKLGMSSKTIRKWITNGTLTERTGLTYLGREGDFR